MALPQRYIEKDFYTEEEYLRWEESAQSKSEFVAGQIRAMSGGTDTHAAIAFNVSVALGSALRGSGCRGLSSDMKVRTADGYFYYPDVTIVCGPRRFHGRGRTVITNPTLVVEVLSDSTALIDRGEKLHHYQTTDSLQVYLLVSQQAPIVEQYVREENGHWDYQAVRGLESSITIPSLSLTLALADVYDQIEFRPEAEGDI